MCCHIFKQHKKYLLKKVRDLLADAHPAPGEDRVQQLGNRQRADGSATAAHPGDVTFPCRVLPEHAQSRRQCFRDNTNRLHGSLARSVTSG